MAPSGHLAQFGKHRPANTQRLTQRVSESHCLMEKILSNSIRLNERCFKMPFGML